MVWLRRFCAFSAIFVVLHCLVTISYADLLEDIDDPTLSDYYSFDPVTPLPVILVPDEVSLFLAPESITPYAIGDDLPDQPPASPVFFGSGYITGTDSSLGNVTLYTPIDYKEGVWGVDRSGYLYNVSSRSLSGYLGGVYNNAWSASAFSYPTYRVYSGSTYTTRTLYLRPTSSNLEIARDMIPRRTESDLLPYIIVGLMGVIVLCCIKRSRT